MRQSSFYIVFLIIFSISASIYSQENITDNSEIIFHEIFLDKDGVVAYDSSGNPWYYDFEEEAFILGERDIPSEGRYKEPPRGDEIPIEVRCTEKKKVKAFVKSIIVGYDEFVDDDILARGRVTIKGWVKGDVTSLNGRILVTQDGKVDGDIEAPEIIVKDGGIVLGNQIISDNPIDIEGLGIEFSTYGIIIVISISVFFIMLNFIILSIFPRQQENINHCIDNNKMKALLFGFIIIPLLPIFLCITIVGIVLIPFIPFIYILAIIAGLIYFGDTIGNTISLRIFKEKKSIYFQTFLGQIFLMALWILTALLLSADQQPAFGFGILFLVISIIITLYPICTGIGAVALTRFGTRKYTSWKDRKQTEFSSKMPAPPPIPKAPNGLNSNITGNINNIIDDGTDSDRPSPPEIPLPPQDKQ